MLFCEVIKKGFLEEAPSEQKPEDPREGLTDKWETDGPGGPARAKTLQWEQLGVFQEL